MQSATQVLNVRLATWTDIAAISDKLFGFVFRGQSDATWDLSTSLERALGKFGGPHPLPTNIEHWMLHEFRRKHHLYENLQAGPTGIFEWFALMQHHGAPTRLLDFTESFYVALYFATSFATVNSSVWAINYLHLRNGLHKVAQLPYRPGHDLRDVVNMCHINLLDGFITNHRDRAPVRYVVPVESTRLSERIARQKGMFLVPTDIGGVGDPTSFMQNLCASFDVQTKDSLVFDTADVTAITEQEHRLHNEVGIIKFDIAKGSLRGIHEQLAMMGLSEETLFPGLDGLARSLIHTCIRT